MSEENKNKFDCSYKGCPSCSWIYYKQQLAQKELERSALAFEKQVLIEQLEYNSVLMERNLAQLEVNKLKQELQQANVRLKKVKDYCNLIEQKCSLLAKAFAKQVLKELE